MSRKKVGIGPREGDFRNQRPRSGNEQFLFLKKSSWDVPGWTLDKQSFLSPKFWFWPAKLGFDKFGWCQVFVLIAKNSVFVAKTLFWSPKIRFGHQQLNLIANNLILRQKIILITKITPSAATHYFDRPKVLFAARNHFDHQNFDLGASN